MLTLAASLACAFFFLVEVIAAPPTTTATSTSTSNLPSATYGNPYLDPHHTIWINTLRQDSSAYTNEVFAAVGRMTNATLIKKALSLIYIPTFTWFDSVAKVPNLGTYLADAFEDQTLSGQINIVQIVIYNIPDRDCSSSSLASHGDFTVNNNGLSKYMQFIDQLVAQIQKYPSVRVVAILEPNAIADLVVRLSVPKCANAKDTYMQGITYAVKQLTSAGVYVYLDAAGAGILGWSANLYYGAPYFAKIFKDAGSPLLLRGLSTNVGGYNALSATTPDPITYGNANYDESHYINAFSVYLQANGFTQTNFIIDQSRSGVQNIRDLWVDWCNVKGAGFGMRPTLNTNSTLIDAIVWVKPGGESDGTSNVSSPYYDSKCSASDANQPAPEYGTWFQSYFEDLVKNANPPL